MPEADGVPERLTLIHRRIAAAGGDPAAVTVVAVTKGFGADAVRAALAAGLGDIGENYAQELVAKHAALGPDGAGARWHFLGSVQRNKVRALAPLVELWQGLARAVEGAEIAAHRPGARCLVEVDTTGARGRGGCPVAEVPALVSALGAHGLVVEGLMTVAPPPPAPAGPVFATVRALADALGLAECSMGMSDDLEAAVAEGSTMVRVGRALFGPRPPRPPAGRPGPPGT